MLQIQQVLNHRYQLQRQLGNNAGRQTWLAQDIATSPAETVIVKLLAFSPQMQWDEFKLFEREAQVLQQLNHPQIPQYRDYFSLDKETGQGLCWFGLVQQYIPGASVRELLNQGKHFTENQVEKLATEVLEILIYLHSLNPPVLHRDIKPSNLILGEDKKIYLVDFGAVQNSAAAEGVTFTVVGTTGYAPLEQFWGRTVPASDLYALGATLIHLLTGTSPADLPQENLTIQFRDRVSVNSNFSRWIEKLTEPHLEQRFTSASEALKALQNKHYLKTSLTTFPQPKGSRVKLKKSPESLSIRIPNKIIIFNTKSSALKIIQLFVNLVLTVGSLPLLLASALVIFGLLLFSVTTLLFNIFTFIFLLFLSFWLSQVWKETSQEFYKVQNSVIKTMHSIFGCQSLYFEQNYFVIHLQLFGLSYLGNQGKIVDIKKIQQIPFQEINIQTNMLTYSFAEQLTESERDWLFLEIKNWLDFKKNRKIRVIQHYANENGHLIKDKEQKINDK
jgi:serine/threonine protein kinase